MACRSWCGVGPGGRCVAVRGPPPTAEDTTALFKAQDSGGTGTAGLPEPHPRPLPETGRGAKGHGRLMVPLAPPLRFGEGAGGWGSSSPLCIRRIRQTPPPSGASRTPIGRPSLDARPGPADTSRWCPFVPHRRLRDDRRPTPAPTPPRSIRPPAPRSSSSTPRASPTAACCPRSSTRTRASPPTRPSSAAQAEARRPPAGTSPTSSRSPSRSPSPCASSASAPTSACRR